MAIFHRGNSDGDVEQGAILALAHGFVMVHSLATSQAGQNVGLRSYGPAYEHGDRFADGFLSRVTESFSAPLSNS